ncbi:MAG: M28 family metallopeptidase, partial [bacterium]
MMKRIALFSLFLISISGVCFAGNRNIPAIRHEGRTDQNPVISNILGAISIDSIRSYMESMSGMGTRYMYAANRKQVAEWIASKFLSFGLTDVKLDSFKMAGDTILTDSVWQYNVVAVIQGKSAPGEITLIGAHHDDYSNPDPYQAPGADDNASGCAAALEIARVIRAKGFNPESTIRFVTFAAEELVGYKMYTGSMYEAEQAAANQDDLRLVVCNDMIANTTGQNLEIFATHMTSGFNSWAGDLTEASAATYCTLNIVKGSYPTSDATFFFDLGYPVAGFQEFGMNPTYHTIQDSVSNCLMDLCTEAIRANAAILLNEQLNPVPQHPECISGKTSITLSWQPTANANVSGYRIYRSLSPDSLFVQVGQTTGLVPGYEDLTAVAGNKYYYRITSRNQSGFESSFSNCVYGSILPKYRDLLVVKDSKGGFNNPSDSTVVAFYNSIFEGLEYDLSDASVSDSLELPVLGKYRKIFWLSNTFSDQQNSSYSRHRDDILTYLRSGGQLFIAGFQPTFLIAKNN